MIKLKNIYWGEDSGGAYKMGKILGVNYNLDKSILNFELENGKLHYLRGNNEINIFASSRWSGCPPIALYYRKLYKFHVENDELNLMNHLPFLTKFCDWVDIQISACLNGKLWSSNEYNKFKKFVMTHDFIDDTFRKRENELININIKDNGQNIRTNFKEINTKEKNIKECVIS